MPILGEKGFPGDAGGKETTSQCRRQETRVRSRHQEDPLEEGMATHSSILAWWIPMDRGAWRATVHRAAKSRTRLKQLSTHGCTHIRWKTAVITQPTFMSFKGGNNWTGALFKFQQGDLSRVITNKCILSIKVISVEKQSRMYNTIHLKVTKQKMHIL